MDIRLWLRFWIRSCSVFTVQCERLTLVPHGNTVPPAGPQQQTARRRWSGGDVCPEEQATGLFGAPQASLSNSYRPYAQAEETWKMTKSTLLTEILLEGQQECLYIPEVKWRQVWRGSSPLYLHGTEASWGAGGRPCPGAVGLAKPSISLDTHTKKKQWARTNSWCVIAS